MLNARVKQSGDTIAGWWNDYRVKAIEVLDWYATGRSIRMLIAADAPFCGY